MGNGIIACLRTSSHLKSKIWIKETSTSNKMEQRVIPLGRTCPLCANISAKTDFSRYLTPCLFLLGYLNERACRDNPQILTELKEAIGTEMRCISSEVTRAVFDSFKKRAQDCIQSGDHYLKNVLFKK